MLGNPLQKTYKLRVKYKKCGPTIWISHLETLRNIMRFVRRAQLPFVVTSGFSPHMKISFSPALSVGLEAAYQEFDVYLNKYINPKTCFELLKEASWDYLKPISVKYVDNNDSLSFNIGDMYFYRAIVDCEIDKVKVPDTICVKKKKGEKSIYVHDYLVGDVLVENNSDSSTLSYALKYTPNGIIKPELFAREVLNNSNYKEANITKIYLDNIKKAE